MPPVMATAPLGGGSGRVVLHLPPGRSDRCCRRRSVPPAAASGARSGRIRCAWTCCTPAVRAVPSAETSGWCSAKVTGRSGASSCADTSSVTGAAAKMSGFGPGTCRSCTVACRLTWPALPLTSAARRADPGAGGVQGVDLDGAVRVRLGERPVHRGIHQDGLPGNAGGGRHRRSLRLDRQVGGLMHRDRRCRRPRPSAGRR